MKYAAPVDYDRISATYDNSRAGEVALVEYLRNSVSINRTMTVLEIGCGTGNYADLMQRLTGAIVYGLDPSAGMLGQAERKNSHLILRQGRAQELPLADARFDFIYMVDVIHHIDGIDKLFAELGRVLKPGARACIMTQSHAQINARPLTRFFPESAGVDQQRYPNIADIIAHAEQQNLRFILGEALFADAPLAVGDEFLALVRAKGYSVLHLISDAAYRAGMHRLEQALRAGSIMAQRAGETAVWLVRE